MSKFSLKQTPAGFSFNLVADNGQIVATSQVYATKAACLKGIERVQANAMFAPVEDQTVKGFEVEACPKFEVFGDKAGKFRFRLKAANGEIIAASQGYKAKASCMGGIDSVRVNAVTADIVEEPTGADLVVYGKIFTSEDDRVVEAFAVKDGKYVYAGDRKGAEAFIEPGRTEVLDYTGKGLVMPSCGNGHAHYTSGYTIHATELATVFNHPEMSADTGRTFDETFSKIVRKMWIQFAKTGNPSLSADISPDGKEYEWPLFDLDNKQVMVLDEFDIHTEKAPDTRIVDWVRTYPLTRYYVL